MEYNFQILAPTLSNQQIFSQFGTHAVCLKPEKLGNCQMMVTPAPERHKYWDLEEGCKFKKDLKVNKSSQVPNS